MLYFSIGTPLCKDGLRFAIDSHPDQHYSSLQDSIPLFILRAGCRGSVVIIVLPVVVRMIPVFPMCMIGDEVMPPSIGICVSMGPSSVFSGDESPPPPSP